MTPDRPRLRDDLQFSHVEADGETQVLIYDPVLNRYHEVGLIHEVILKKLNGVRSLVDVVNEIATEVGAELPLDVLRAFLSQARGLYLLDAGSTEAFSAADGAKV